MDISLENLKKEFEENPIGVISAAAMAATAIMGLGNMASNMRNSRTWKKEVQRRVKMTNKK